MHMALRASAAALVFAALVAGSGALGRACNKDFKVFNRSGKTMMKLYVSPYQSGKWEDNVLSGTVEPHTSLPIDMSDDTRKLTFYAVKAVFEDGTKTEGYKINLCRAAQINIYDDKVTYIDGQ